MRFLHTSDWHLGRSFHRVDLLAEQAATLDHLVEVVRAEAVDVVVVAGDVYDRALPGVDVVALLDDALARLAGTGATVVLTSGNHDSPRRLGFAARLLEGARVHVRTDPARSGEPVLLEDGHGPVAIYPLPYLEPALVGPALGQPAGAGHEAVLGAAMAAVRADLATRPAGTRSVVAAHAFVVGGAAQRQRAGHQRGRRRRRCPRASSTASTTSHWGTCTAGRCSRAPSGTRVAAGVLVLGARATSRARGWWSSAAGGVERVDPVDAPVPRRLALLRGPLEDLLADPAHAGAEGAWCQVTLTDDERPAEAMARLRARFPHTLELRFEPAGGPRVGSYTQRTAARSDLELCCGFVEHVRHRAPGEEERAVLQDAVAGARVALARESGVAPLRAGRRLLPPPPAAASEADEARAAG